MLKKTSGFTLVELMITVTILLILGSIALVKYSNVTEKGRSAEAYATLADIASAESAYYVENDAYTNAWGNLDRYDAAPVSNDFDYSTALANVVASHYVKAIHIAGRGTLDYYMCVTGGARGTSAPACP